MAYPHKFPPLGLTYFWFLNDVCDDELIDRQIEEFSRAQIGTVCLHPRDGLLLPYGSSNWFDFIRRTVKKLAAKNIGVWLYDDDPYPSGNAGGRIVLDHPEFIAKKIVMHRADPASITGDGLWCFPANGSLVSCAMVSEENGELLRDMTGNVGLVRRTWEMLKNWDSKWYYPATPLYVSDRAMAHVPEYAVKAGNIPEKQILVAFTIESVPNQVWNFLVDPLNPLATRKFIECTHERYFQCVGDMFGKEITAIFTDEAKYYGETPWTPGIFEDFQKKYGYDLRPRLYDLFNYIEAPESILTKVNYREWCGRRFEDAWLKPVSAWCRKHKLEIVGHFSPEEEPVSQSKTLSNLMPLQKHMSLAGLDLIVPAVGDSKHPLLNIGILSAVSSAQQHKMTGVMSESLACSGKDFTVEKARRILNWQTVMGATTIVAHGSFHSLRAEREFEAPPDLGPSSKFRDGFMQLSKDLKPVQEMLLGATQIAPVAILWPIKSFYHLNKFWQAEPGGLRGELTDLVLACLESHVGIQLLDEADFQNAKLNNGTLKIGNASYSHVIIPGSTIWSKTTWDLLGKYSESDLKIYQHGTRPMYLESNAELYLNSTAAEKCRGYNKSTPVAAALCCRVPIQEIAPRHITEIEQNAFPPFEELTEAMIRNDLPKLMNIKSVGYADIRITGWKKNKKISYLLCHLGEGAVEAEADNKIYELSGQRISVIGG